MALINAVFAPFIVLYLLMYSFFRYFEVRYHSSTCLHWSLTFRCRSTTRTPDRKSVV